MENRNDILLERFFARQLTPEELSELEARLAKDAELAETFAFQQQVARAFTVQENQRLKKILQAEEASLRPAAKSIRFNFRQWSAVAAVFLGLAAAVWFMYPGAEPAPDDYFSAYPEVFSSRGAGEDENLLAEAMVAYKNQDYPAAARAFGALHQSNPSELTATFYLGVSRVGARQYSEAVPVLESLTRQSENEDFQAAAQWYLAVAHLGLGNKQEARQAAEAYLSHPNSGGFREQARDLLDAL